MRRLFTGQRGQPFIKLVGITNDKLQLLLQLIETIKRRSRKIKTILRERTSMSRKLVCNRVTHSPNISHSHNRRDLQLQRKCYRTL
ncbi:hypothetical protein RchiOBHm_Chr2g0173711 [Rosa chinensis]|uniref:Uncharacterized protein n=1 Tax=Rosa chinensis TaxID=74649 RepID=A0A2P6S5Y0_ROSCH|nr:hypothetical protein RchiOBHm_Chr2g0173711 [Rosa chinensis]